MGIKDVDGKEIEKIKNVPNRCTTENREAEKYTSFKEK